MGTDLSVTLGPENLEEEEEEAEEEDKPIAEEEKTSQPAKPKSLRIERPSLFTPQEAYRIAQSYSLGFGIGVYTMFVFSTGSLLATTLSFLRIIQSTKVVIASAEDVNRDDALGWASFALAVLQWVASLTYFIWYHVLCRKCSRENLLRASVSKCVQLLSVPTSKHPKVDQLKRDSES